MPAAKLVRRATTAKGEKPWLIASLPKMGAIPRNTAELKAAKIPAECFFCKEYRPLQFHWRGLGHLINAFTSSRNSSFRKSPFCIRA